MRPTARRRSRIERELRALRVMEGHLNTRDIFWAIVTIPGVALLCLAIAAKLHWLSNSFILPVAGALAAALIVWWIGRRWLVVAVLIVIALICLLMESAPELTDLSGNRKTARRQKLEKAIARREALLRAMDRSPS